MSSEDTEAIEGVIARQFESLTWEKGQEADWRGFERDFLDGAPLYPAARPASAQSVEAFVERMRGLSNTTLASFDERVLGTRILAFGNVAVAVAVAEMTENGREVSRNVEMMLLVKSDGAWRIAAQAWDRATPERPIPEEWVAG